MNELFREIFTATQEELGKKMLSFLAFYYGKENVGTDKGRKAFVCATGNIPVVLVAHLDTVHRKSNIDTLFVDKQDRCAWSPDGLGADDRAGVYTILQIILKGYRPHIIFAYDEEIGGVGATTLTKYEVPFADDINFMIELDRQGSKDAVFYDCDNKDFHKLIEGFGFKKEIGSFSDIRILSPFFDCASVNLSIGYYDQHSKNEYLLIPEMLETEKKVCNILDWAVLPENIDTKFDFQKYVYVYKNHRKDDFDDKFEYPPSKYYDDCTYQYFAAHKKEFVYDDINKRYTWLFKDCLLA